MNINLIFIRVLLLNGIIYGSVGFLPWLSPFVLQEMQLDKLITFNPYSIYLYLSFFILIWYTFIKIEDKSIRELSIMIPASAFFAAIIYILYPTTISREINNINSDILTSTLYYVINKSDSSMNCLPSLHGAITVICVYYLLINESRIWLNIKYIIWGLAICWSAVAIRQHLSIDIISGMLYGVILLLLKNYIIAVSENITSKLK